MQGSAQWYPISYLLTPSCEDISNNLFITVTTTLIQVAAPIRVLRSHLCFTNRLS